MMRSWQGALARQIIRLWTCCFAVLAIVLCEASALAADDCAGPPACCITNAKDATVPLPTSMRVGIRVMRLEKIVEQDGYYSGEVTLLQRWQPGGLRAELLPRNGVDINVPLDTTKLFAGSCYREKRITGKFQSWFRLRRFPFDSQELRLNLEERAFSDDQLVILPELWPSTISVDAFRELSAWRVADYPKIERVHRSTFAFPMDSEHPRLILIHTRVDRLWQFYLTRFFLPLFLLVALSYAIFWIKPEDLGSASAIGITVMLSIIAFQLSMVDTLPHVPYLTIADRIYTVCYILIAVALGFAVFEAYLSNGEKGALAQKYDRMGRTWFPLAFVISVAFVSVFGWYKNADPDADTQKLPPAVAPPGEK